MLDEKNITHQVGVKFKVKYIYSVFSYLHSYFDICSATFDRFGTIASTSTFLKFYYPF